MSLLLTLEILSNLKETVKQRMYMVMFRKSMGLSRLAWLTISRIRSEEIGSLRLTAAVPRILLAADLTLSTTELSVGDGTPAIFDAVKGGINHAVKGGINHAGRLGLF